MKLTLKAQMVNEELIKIQQQIEELLEIREELMATELSGFIWKDGELVEIPEPPYNVAMLKSEHYRNRGQLKFDFDATYEVEEFDFDIEVGEVDEDFELSDLM